MKTPVMIPSDEGIPSPLVDIEPDSSGYQNRMIVIRNIVNALDPGFPTGELVEL
jgi:hypothetical protein